MQLPGEIHDGNKGVRVALEKSERVQGTLVGPHRNGHAKKNEPHRVGFPLVKAHPRTTTKAGARWVLKLKKQVGMRGEVPYEASKTNWSYLCESECSPKSVDLAALLEWGMQLDGIPPSAQLAHRLNAIVATALGNLRAVKTAIP